VSPFGVVEVGVEVELSTHVLQITTLPQTWVVVIKPFNPILEILYSSFYDVLLISVS
jgi:hypothetical protein